MGEQAAARDLSPAAPTSAIRLQTYDASTSGAVVPVLTTIYRDVYAEPPYGESDEDVHDFVESMPRRAQQPGFRLVVAYSHNVPVGFAFGHQLTSETRWWQGAAEPLPKSFTRETSGRTFAIIEIAVLSDFRRRGIARSMHDQLLNGRQEERATLLVRPEAGPANSAYASWGYSAIGSIRPWSTAPLYTAMIKVIQNG
jgi:ribosomal protein S18 acetylase RimI-like enzyme